MSWSPVSACSFKETSVYIYSSGDDTAATNATVDNAVYDQPLFSAKDLKPEDKNQLFESANADYNSYSAYA